MQTSLDKWQYTVVVCIDAGQKDLKIRERH